MPHSAAPLGPVSLQPIYDHRVWGSVDLGPWYPAADPSNPVGEAWLTAKTCIVESGPQQGTTLADLAKQNSSAFAADSTGHFPLLVKVLFPKEKLSVQVHPDDAGAQKLGMPNGKTECWYILSADPGATIAVGLREPISTQRMRSAIEAGTIEQDLNHLPVKAGDMVYLDAGTVHALGPGVIVLETQQYSDATFRLFDYGRPRELHLDAGLAATRAITSAGIVQPTPMSGFVRLIAAPFFLVDKFQLEANAAASLALENSMQILVALTAGCTVQTLDGKETPLHPGHAVVLPAESIARTLTAGDAPAEIIRIARP